MSFFGLFIPRHVAPLLVIQVQAPGTPLVPAGETGIFLGIRSWRGLARLAGVAVASDL